MLSVTSFRLRSQDKCRSRDKPSGTWDLMLFAFPSRFFRPAGFSSTGAKIEKCQEYVRRMEASLLEKLMTGPSSRKTAQVCVRVCPRAPNWVITLLTGPHCGRMHPFQIWLGVGEERGSLM